MNKIFKILGTILLISLSCLLMAQENLDVEGNVIIHDENGDQFEFKTDGENVGLEIRDIDGVGNNNQPYIDFSNDPIVDFDTRFIFDNNEIFTIDTRAHDLRFSSNSGEKIRFSSNGYVGIGTNSPLQSLHIGNNGNLRLDGSSTTYTIFNTYQNSAGGNNLQIDPNCTDNTKSSTIRLFRGVNVNGAQLQIFRGNNTTQVNHQLHSYDGPSYLCGLTGNVGIGTKNPLGYKLAVKGNIGAEEIEVRTNYWADFVFEEDYNLRSLEELETFIKKHGHLPTMISEEEAIKSPLNLGDMDVKLLQTVEELTLYTIDQQKLLDQQQAMITEMYQEIQNLKKLVQDEK